MLSLIAGIAVALATSGGTVLPSFPQPEEPIRILSVSFEVQFPDRIVLDLETEGVSEITQVTLFYRLGSQSIVTYGYPMFAPAQRVSAEFIIKTGGAQYIPSGVEIEYYYVIRDADGRTFESERYQLEYLDPRFDWQEVRIDNLRLLYHGRPADEVLKVATEVNGRLEPVRDLLGLDSTRPLKAVILNDGRESRSTFPFISETARRGHIFGGFAFSEYDLFVLLGLSTEGMVHELTHLLINQGLDSPLAKMPAWLNEGLAMYFESDSRRPTATVETAARAGRLMPLRTMGSVPGRPSDVARFYAQSWDVVTYMMEVHGEQKMAALLRAINDGKNVDRAVFQAYAMSLDELERDWKARLLGETPVTDRAYPGTFATTAIIAGAVGTAIMAAAIRWARKGFWPPRVRPSRQ